MMEKEKEIALTCPNCKAPVHITPVPGQDTCSFRCARCGKYSTVNNLLALDRELKRRGA